MIAEPNDRLRRNIEIYHEAAEKAGFPDMHKPRSVQLRLGRREAGPVLLNPAIPNVGRDAEPMGELAGSGG